MTSPRTTVTERNIPERIVIVGFGPVAARLVDHILPLVTTGHAALTVVGSERDPAYNRVLVADVAVGHVSEAALGLADVDALTRAGVDVRLGVGVQHLDRDAYRVVLDDGTAIPYDRLVLATGSAPVLPPLSGVDRSTALPHGVHFLRDLDDARTLSAALIARHRLLVLGSGVLGIEAALAAAGTGADVTLVHHGRAPMERLLGDGSRVLAAALRSAGIRVVAGTALGVERTQGRLTGLHLGDGSVVPTDAIVIACGVRPRVELAVGASLPVSDGVLVDHTGRVHGTEDLWAIGDCAEVRCLDTTCAACAGSTTPQGLIGPGWQQADQLGTALTAELLGSATTTAAVPERREAVLALKAHGFDAVAAGDTAADQWSDDPGLAVAVWADPGHGRYVKMVTRDGVLTGLVSIGMPRTGAELVLLFERGSELPADRSTLLRLDSAEGALTALPPGPDATLCRCAGISRGTVQDAVASGCASVPEVSSITRAGTGCGSCKDDIRAVIEQHFAAVPVAP